MLLLRTITTVTKTARSVAKAAGSAALGTNTPNLRGLYPIMGTDPATKASEGWGG